MTTPHAPTTQDLAHFSFCALVALHISIQDGLVTSPLGEHLFLVRWLATAQKQKRFTRRLAVDIQLLLDKGRRQGEKAQLKKDLIFLWSSFTGDKTTHNDLYRLAEAIKQLNTQGWENILLDPPNSEPEQQADSVESPVFYVAKQALTDAFTEQGVLIAPISFQIVGDAQAFVARLAEWHFKTEITTISPNRAQVTLVLRPDTITPITP
ncbi:DUF2913 family protein [Budvicia aquatica]|uniref:DUF2913 domain-containing protein n=1 Tax=Budvicia aquatica TaxID=82979 RepID=A0A2C6DT82_9GAMM|nr:DUF2913 family protein [Budvicia aquatica]PHI31542.1 DUF2913 domain-containing protein [Budvicia aquatica]VFS52014.1 Protein of uncharacterised function (DUF2913) [Budvicia aquatica]